MIYLKIQIPAPGMLLENAADVGLTSNKSQLKSKMKTSGLHEQEAVIKH